MSTAVQMEHKCNYEPAEGEVLEQAVRIVRSGVLSNIHENIFEKGISMDYAKGIIWLAACKDVDTSCICPKQRTRLKKLMERGFIDPMTDAELSKLTSHEAEVLIEHGSSEYFQKQRNSTRSSIVKNHNPKV